MSEAPKPEKKSGGKKKLLIPLLAALVLAAGAGGWFSGIIPKVLGKEHAPEHAERAENTEKAQDGKAEAARAPIFMDLPDIVANLNTGNRRAAYVKLKAKLELTKPEDQPVLTAAKPPVGVRFEGSLRGLVRRELRGTAGTYRLREELLARTNLAAPPARVVAVLFTEMIVQ